MHDEVVLDVYLTERFGKYPNVSITWSTEILLLLVEVDAVEADWF
jgi:hypothetical protein